MIGSVLAPRLVDMLDAAEKYFEESWDWHQLCVLVQKGYWKGQK